MISVELLEKRKAQLDSFVMECFTCLDDSSFDEVRSLGKEIYKYLDKQDPFKYHTACLFASIMGLNQTIEQLKGYKK